MNPCPKITVMIAVLNQAETIQRAIDSFAGQTYSAKELIVMDGGSTDGTAEIVEKNREKLNYWESKPDRGIGHAWNKGLKRSSGDWIYFMGADDHLWEPNTLERIASRLLEIPRETKIVYGKVNVVGKSGEILWKKGKEWNRKRFLQSMCIPHQGTFHHRSIFEVFGEFDESLRMTADYDMALRVLKNSDALFLADIIVAGMGYGGMSSSPKNTWMLLREIGLARRRNGIGIFPLAWYLGYLQINAYWLLVYLLGMRNTQKLRKWYRKIKASIQCGADKI